MDNKTAVSSTTTSQSGDERHFERQTSQSTTAALHLTGHEFDHLGAEHAVVPELLLNDAEWERVEALVTQNALYPVSPADLCVFRGTYRKHCEVRSTFPYCYFFLYFENITLPFHLSHQYENNSHQFQILF